MLSIIIVNYRSASLIVECLRTLYHYNRALLFEVLVVDNNSGDNSKETITSQFPQVCWIDMGYNAGFARANNAGIRHAKGHIVLLLNPDTLSIENSVEQCYISLEKSNYIAAGVQLLNADGSLQAAGSFFVRGGLNHLLPIPYWGAFIRWIGYKAKHQAPSILESKAVQEVDWINGAFLMVKKAAIEKAGLLDEDFFLYAEEIEWCSRLKKAGRLCIFGTLRMVHLQGETINQAQNTPDKGYYNLYDRKGLQLIVSNHLRVRKQYGAGWFLFLLLNYTFGLFVFLVAGTLHCLFILRNPAGVWNKAGAFAKNLFRLWRLTPLIIRNKPHFYKMF